MKRQVQIMYKLTRECSLSEGLSEMGERSYVLGLQLVTWQDTVCGSVIGDLGSF